MSTHGWSPRRRGALVLAVAALAAAVVVVVVFLRAQVSAPTPQVAGTIDAPPTSRPTATASPAPHATPLGPSRPVSISIPSIGVHSPVNPIGLTSHGELAVPQPGPHLDEAAWFENSPTPGQPGPSIIEGHVDSPKGPSVFLKLGELKPGDTIVVRRADRRSLTFTVDGVRDYLKTAFPTRLVYGDDDLSRPTLRLITCSNFDEASHHHVGNEVVFAHLSHVASVS